MGVKNLRMSGTPCPGIPFQDRSQSGICIAWAVGDLWKYWFGISEPDVDEVLADHGELGPIPGQFDLLLII
jgi:hypothetical protein